MAANSEMQIRRTATSPAVGSPSASASLSSNNPSSSSAKKECEGDETKPLLYSDFAVRFNENSLEQCRTSVSVLAGCVAGIIGLTSYKGFVFYGLSMFLLSLIVFVFIRHEHRKFFTTLNHVFTNGFLNGLLTYVLFLDVFLYGIVHLY